MGQVMKKQYVFFLSCLVCLSVAGCGEPPAETEETQPEGEPALFVSLDRRPAEGANIIVVQVEPLKGGAAAPGEEVKVSAEGGVVSAVTEVESGKYEAEVAPENPSGEVVIKASALGLSIERTAVVLPELDVSWGQPERVPGLVNTKGYEDSAEVSPDGEWLIVSSYSPIDLICCFSACQGGTAADPASPACNTSLGPFDAPARPDLPGANRILSPTEVHDELPSMGIDLPDGEDFQSALPPVAAYGFHRQADGSFAEPFVIAYEADGSLVAPFGFNFLKVDGSSAQAQFAWSDIREVGAPDSTGNDLFQTTLDLGQKNNLGTASFTGGVISLDKEPTPLQLPDRSGPQGNPGVSSDGVWFDTEEGAFDLFFAAGDPLAGPLSTPVKVALCNDQRREYQPYMHDDRLYFAADFADIRSSARSSGGDPGQVSTWSEERVEVAAEPGAPRVGAIVSIGEPSLSDRDGITTLYFIYARRTENGFDMSVGRVDRKP